MMRIATFLMAAWVVVGCRGVGLSGPDKEARLTEAKLKTKLSEFTDNYSIIVQAASEIIVAGSEDPADRRAAVAWKAHTIPLVRKIVREKPPMDALLDLWALSYQTRDLAQSSETHGHNETLLAAGDELIENLEHLAVEVLDEEDFEQARAAVAQFASEHPMSRSLARGTQLPSESADPGGGASILRSVPIIGSLEGLGETPRAIGEFTQMAGQLGEIASSMPEEIRWQMELALYDAESRETTASLREGIDSITASTETLTEVIATLPDDVQNLLDSSFESLEASREGIHDTLGQAQATVADIDAALSQGILIAASAERTALSVASAAASLEGLSLALVELTATDEEEEAVPAPPPAATSSPPFDISDYGDTADSLRDAVEELRGLLGDVRSLVDEKAYRAPIDHVFLRVLQAVGAVLLAFVLYRLSMSALAKRAS